MSVADLASQTAYEVHDGPKGTHCLYATGDGGADLVATFSDREDADFAAAAFNERAGCIRSAPQPKVLTFDNQGPDKKIQAVKVKVQGSGESFAAAVIDPDTDQNLGFAGCTAATWEMWLTPGADTGTVRCLLENVPVEWVN